MMTYYIGMVALPAMIVDHVYATLQSQCQDNFIAQGGAHPLDQMTQGVGGRSDRPTLFEAM